MLILQMLPLPCVISRDFSNFTRDVDRTCCSKQEHEIFRANMRIYATTRIQHAKLRISIGFLQDFQQVGFSREIFPGYGWAKTVSQFRHAELSLLS